MHGHFDMGYPESTFLKYALGRGGGGHKKEYAVYARENDDNSGRPLSSHAVDTAILNNRRHSKSTRFICTTVTRLFTTPLEVAPP